MRPERTLREAPPSRDAVTTSRTWLDSVEVNTLTSSGMIAPARVPHVMTVESFHQSVPSPSPGISSQDTMYVSATETIDVSQTRLVSGTSKFIRVALPYRAPASASFTMYDAPLAKIMMMRITKIHTRSCTWTSCWGTATRMNAISATPVTPYVSKPSAVGPTESPALSPVQSAMTPGLRASSSLMLKTIFMRSEPMSAILVKMPPQMRRAEAPSDSPMAKPMKQGPASSLGRNARMQIMKNSSMATSRRPTLMPDLSGMSRVARALMRMPNHATP